MKDKIPGKLLFSEDDMSLEEFAALAIKLYRFEQLDRYGAGEGNREYLWSALAQINRAINNREFTEFDPDSVSKIIWERTGVKTKYQRGVGFIPIE